VYNTAGNMPAPRLIPSGGAGIAFGGAPPAWFNQPRARVASRHYRHPRVCVQNSQAQSKPSASTASPCLEPSRAAMPTRTATPTAHIWLDEQGRAWVDDTNVKVIEIVLDRLGWGFTPGRMLEEHPGMFTLGQVHAALSYYYDHQAEFDAEIEGQRLPAESE
jgi:hypothetical protein